MFSRYKIYILFLSIVLFYTFYNNIYAESADVYVTGRVQGCGDGMVDLNEQCDGNPVTHNSCSNIGFSSGNLGCTNACNYDTSSCLVNNQNNNTNPPGTSFSFNNFFNKNVESIDDFFDTKLSKNSVIFEGDAEIGSVVTIRDENNKIVAQTISDDKGRYSISVSNTSKTENIFTLTNNNESKTFIVNMYSNNVVKYNDVSLINVFKLKAINIIITVIKEYKNKTNVDLTKNQTKIN